MGTAPNVPDRASHREADEGCAYRAGAFRYPTPGGRLVDPPAKEKMLGDLKVLREHTAVSRKELLPATTPKRET